MDLTCPWCKAITGDESAFCPSCGRPLKAEGVDDIVPPNGSNTDERATIYLMLAIMGLFFGFFLLVPGYFVGLGLVIPAVCLIVVGFVFLSARYYVLRRYVKRVERIRAEAAVRVRCRYCGALNPDSARRCESCGATL